MDRDLVVSSSCLVCTKRGKLIAGLIPSPGAGIDTMEEAMEYADLFAKAPQMEDICKQLAKLFPNNSMEEMDAADFKDKAGETFHLVLKARKVLGVEPIPDYEDPEDA